MNKAKALLIIQMVGLFLLFSGFVFVFYATASISQQWDWGLALPFDQMIPIHANGALFGLASSVLGVVILLTSKAQTKRERSIMVGIFLGFFLWSGLIYRIGPVF